MKRCFWAVVLPVVLAVELPAVEKEFLPGWLDLGADLRVRDEYTDGIKTLARSEIYSEQNVVRFRARAWAGLKSAKSETGEFFVNARASAEPRWWTKDVSASMGSGVAWRWALLDQLNAGVRNAGGLPLTVTVGRQDLGKGGNEIGWLIADGTPIDGSWTLFFDAARAVLDLEKSKLRVELTVVKQAAEADSWLPVVGANHDSIYMTEQDERALIASAYKYDVFGKGSEAGVYFIYKHDSRVLGNGDSGETYTLGAHVARDAAEGIGYSLDGVWQFGQKNDEVAGARRQRDVRAYAGLGSLYYAFGDRLKNKVVLNAEYLSGDRGGEKDGMFDILWGRFPRWSEILNIAYTRETNGRAGQFNNLGRLGLGWEFFPWEKTQVTVDYSALFAPEEVPTRATHPGMFSGESHFRGQLVKARVGHDFGRGIKGHLLGEVLFKGDYYENGGRLVFLRAEMSFAW